MGERCNSTSSVRTHDCVDCSSLANEDRTRSSEDRKIAQEKIGRSEDVAQEKIGRSAADLQKIGRDLPKIGRSRKRAQSARMTLLRLSRAARPPLSYFSYFPLVRYAFQGKFCL